MFFVCLAVGLFFASLYLRYKSQQPSIMETAQSFMQALKSNDTVSLADYTAPELQDQVTALESESGSLLSHLMVMTENNNYFNYGWIYSKSESTKYEGVLTFDNGEKTNIVIQLELVDGKWLVYGINITPISTASFGQ